jgi:hypothetical protein
MLGSYQRKMIFLIIDGIGEPQSNTDHTWEEAGGQQRNHPSMAQRLDRRPESLCRVEY